MQFRPDLKPAGIKGTPIGRPLMGMPRAAMAMPAGQDLLLEGRPAFHVRANLGSQVNTTLATGSGFMCGWRNSVTGRLYTTTSGFLHRTTLGQHWWFGLNTANVSMGDINGEIEAFFISVMFSSEFNKASGGRCIAGFNGTTSVLYMGGGTAAVSGEVLAISQNGTFRGYYNTPNDTLVRSHPYVIGAVWGGNGYDLWVNGARWATGEQAAGTAGLLQCNTLVMLNRAGLDFGGNMAMHELVVYRRGGCLNVPQIMARMAENCGATFQDRLPAIRTSGDTRSLAASSGQLAALNVPSFVYSPFYGTLSTPAFGTSSIGTDGQLYYLNTSSVRTDVFSVTLNDRRNGFQHQFAVNVTVS